MTKTNAGWAPLSTLWRALGDNGGTSRRANFSIEGSWSHGNSAWFLRAQQEMTLGGACIDVVILGSHTVLFRLPGDSCGRKCRWLLASCRSLEWSSPTCAVLLCNADCANGTSLSFRLNLFSGSRELEIVELDPRERPRMQKLFSGIRWSLR